MLRYNISSQNSETITTITAQGKMKYADSSIYIMDKSQIELLSYADTANVANLQKNTITPAGGYKIGGYSSSSVISFTTLNPSLLLPYALCTRTIGDKRYELKDHLGNVRVVISDIKEPVDDAYDQFTADLKSYFNYYPFGMLQPGRKYNDDGYNFGFQGQEVEDDISGDNNHLVFTYRIHDVRLGRFMSVDPLFNSYPSNSQYAFAQNRVVDGVDLEGREWIHYKVKFSMLEDGRVKIWDKSVINDFRNYSEDKMINIHKNTKGKFYDEYSKGFGSKGQGVLYKYVLLDDKGDLITTFSQWDVETGLTRHGFYYGRGSVTKYGQLLTSRGYGNYNFDLQPIDMVDAIAKVHDMYQNVEHYKGFMDIEYIGSDIVFVNMLLTYLEEIQDPNYIDPFTGKAPSQEARDAAMGAVIVFNGVIALKMFKIQKMRLKEDITEEEFNAIM